MIFGNRKKVVRSSSKSEIRVGVYNLTKFTAADENMPSGRICGILALSEKIAVVYLSFCTVSFSAGWFNQKLIRRSNRSEKKRQTQLGKQERQKYIVGKELKASEITFELMSWWE